MFFRLNGKGKQSIKMRLWLIGKCKQPIKIHFWLIRKCKQPIRLRLWLIRKCQQPIRMRLWGPSYLLANQRLFIWVKVDLSKVANLSSQLDAPLAG
jgi:hypothetical protein